MAKTTWKEEQVKRQAILLSQSSRVPKRDRGNADEGNKEAALDAKRAAIHAQQEKLNAELAALGAPKTKKPKTPVPKVSPPKPPPPTAPHTDVQGHVTDYIKIHFYCNNKFVCNVLLSQQQVCLQ